MKMTEIKSLETKELAERVESETAKYNQMKLNHAVTPLENPSQIKAARRYQFPSDAGTVPEQR